MEKIIKNIGNKVKKKEIYLHPNTLYIREMEDINEYPTKYYIKNNKLFFKNITEKYNKKNKKELVKYMLYPSTVIMYNEILNLYNIISYDDLFDKIKELINLETPYNTINRLINCWIRLNYKDLKKNNKILINIYIYIFEHYYPKIELDKDNVLDEINKWFISNKQSTFNLDLGNEIMKYLKIYE
jgi:hypothetical protein